jgi:soluble cytochrome b562
MIEALKIKKVKQIIKEVGQSYKLDHLEKPLKDIQKKLECNERDLNTVKAFLDRNKIKSYRHGYPISLANRLKSFEAINKEGKQND